MANSDENTSIVPAAKPAKLTLAQRLLQTDPEELTAAVATKIDALLALGSDTALPAALQQAVKDIVAMASPQRPGMEEMDRAWRLPRVSIAQPTTQSESKPDSAKNGDMFTTAGQLLERPLGIIPIYFHEENINFPQQSKNPVCYSMDAKLGSPFGECAKCPHLPFGKQNGGRGDQQRTDCQNNIVCVALTADLKQLLQIQFGKTSRKAGSALMSLAGAQSFVWRQSYVLDTEKKTADVGVYYVYKVAPTGKDNDAGVQKIAHALYELWAAERNRQLQSHYLRPARAPQQAVEAEGQFAAGALDAGLGDGGEEPDLSTPTTPTAASPNSASGASGKGGPAPAGKGGAKSSAKPM